MKRQLNRCSAALTLLLGLALAGPVMARGPVAPDHAYAQTQYPIVLVHGLAGFDQILGVDYFFKVLDDLRHNGATVLVARLSQVNSSAVRGEQLIKQLQQWSAAYGYRKFNLIAHSQGGVDSRYAAGIVPDLVASITTVSSPTTLSASANNAQGIGAAIQAFPSAVQALGSLIAWLSGHGTLPQDVSGLATFPSEVNQFATRFPAGVPSTYCGQGAPSANGIYLFSVAGAKVKTNALDPADLVLVQYAAPSDGVFLTCDTHFGRVLRDDYPWNHLDEINQTLGLIGQGAPDPVAFYRQHANRLRQLGL